MSDTENQMIKAKTLRAFNDASNEASYAADQEIALTQGEFTNFEAAGLVVAVPAAEPAETKTRTPRG